ncbi:YpmS family protein [Melissococcus plutonius]|uniref:YpmS family protein n=1 Tax=Melissococcus plutonius TaxID=33970 RepID=UPI003C2D1753
MKRSNQLKETETKKKINPWKFAFLILIGFLAGTALFLGLRLTQIREPEYKFSSKATTVKESTPVMTVHSTKKQVNQLMDFYLKDLQKDAVIKYDFYLENEAMLKGTLRFLGHDIAFYLYFDPYVMNNGNVQLKAKSLSIGTLGLPIKDVLRFVERSYKLPEWVTINPEEKLVVLHLDRFQMRNGLFIRANKINLVDDKIQLSVYLPKDKTYKN